MIPEDQTTLLHNDVVRGDILQLPDKYLTPAIVSKIILRKRKTLQDWVLLKL